MAEYSMRPVFVFDGKPPELKKATLEARRLYREKARREWEEASSKGDYKSAWSKAVRMNSLNKEMQDDAKKLLALLGVPVVQAPEEGEAQAAYMAASGDVWAANSRDYDSVLFGAPRLVRYVTISGQEFLPSKGVARPLIPELIELDRLLAALEITRNQLIDLAILVGTDFNKGIHGIGPKTALKLIKTHGSLLTLPEHYTKLLPDNVEELRLIFTNPSVTRTYDIRFKEPNELGLREFLCEQRGFSPDRVDLALERTREFHQRERSSLQGWLSGKVDGR
jgi:flap endonuclease-1